MTSQIWPTARRSLMSGTRVEAAGWRRYTKTFFWCIASRTLMLFIVFQPATRGVSDNASSTDLSFYSLSSSPLRVTIVEIEPYVIAADRGGSSNRTVTAPRYIGYIPDLLRKLSTMTNFRFELYAVSDGSYGYQQPTGKWTGMIGELIKGAADMAAGSIFITDVRREVVDFTEPFLNAHASILLRKPSNGEPTLKTVDDVISKSDIKYGTLSTGIIPRAFKRTNDTTLRTMWRNMLRFGASVFTTTNEEGISRVKSGDRFAFVLPDTIGEYVSLRQPCQLVLISPFLLTNGYALALRKNSPHVDALNVALRALRKTGWLDRLKHQWWAARSECNGIRSSKMYSLNAAASSVTSTLTTTMMVPVIMRYWSVRINKLLPIAITPLISLLVSMAEKLCYRTCRL